MLFKEKRKSGEKLYMFIKFKIFQAHFFFKYKEKSFPKHKNIEMENERQNNLQLENRQMAMSKVYFKMPTVKSDSRF